MTAMKRIFPIIIFLSALNAFAGPVEQYGRLYTDGNKIVGEKSGGEAVQLKGPSLQWSVRGWGSDLFFIEETVDAMVDGWNAQIIRVPLGLSFDKGPNHRVGGGYDTLPEENWERVRRVADRAIERGVYAIVDWHSHTAHNPDETELAIDFFTNPNRAGKYGSNPAVIFEIYNEPEMDVTWPEVKAYSEKVIKAIRDAGFNNLILVGSPNWALMTDVAANDPPQDPLNNFALTFHFYAAGHMINARPWFHPAGSGSTFRSIVQGALDAGHAVFVTEWGTNDATSTNPSNFAETDKWHAYLDSNKISSCAWGVTASDYNILDFWPRAGSPLLHGRDKLANWTNPRWMTPHGRYIYHWLTGNDTTFTITGPVFPVFTGPRAPIELPLPSLMSHYTNNGGQTSLSVADGVIHFTYALEQGTYQWTPYAGVYFGINGLCDCEYGISYMYKGSPHQLRAEQSDVTDYAIHAHFIELIDTDDWIEVTVPWSNFHQPGWGVSVAQDKSKVTALSWYVEGAAGTSGEFWVRSIYCLDPSSSSVKPNRGLSSYSGAAPFVKVSGRTLHLRLAKDGRVDIFNLKGGRLRTLELKKGEHAIRVNNLPRGTYIIKAGSGNSWSKPVRMLVK